MSIHISKDLDPDEIGGMLAKMEDDGMRDGKNCKGCVYYHEPDIEMDFKVCNFPWFDHTPEDELLMDCIDEQEAAADE